MTLLESRVEGLWWAKQTAKGTPATAADKQGRKVGGDMNVNRDDGSENYSDGSRFGDAVDFVNTLVGEGSPVLQAQPGVVGHLAAMILGSEAVTGAGDPYTHVATPGTAGYWNTVWKKVGASVGPLRQKFNDCRLVSLRIEGSTANKVVKVTPQWLSLDPGEIFATDPVKVIDADLPFLFTEGAGRFDIDGDLYEGESSFAIVISDGVTPAYGDSVTPFDVGFGIANVTLEAITIALNNDGLVRYYNQIYGTSVPAPGAKPIQSQPLPGSYTVDLQKSADRQLKIEVPAVHWSPDLAIAGNPDGGVTELPLAGEARALSGQPRIKVTTKSADALAY